MLHRWKSVLGPAAVLLLLGVAPTFSAQSPERPRILLDTTYTSPTGRQLSVPAGGDLQGALNSAQPGDAIVLQAGATYTGNFTLPAKSGSGWIHIQTSALSSLPAPGTRVGPAQASLMPKIVSPNTTAAISTAAGAHHYRFVGVEITTTFASTSATNYGLVVLEAPNGNTTLAQVPTDLTIDRCYIHGTSTGNVRRAILMNSARTAVVDSYLSELHEVGADSQAIAAYNGPGPFKIVNNYLEGAGENLLFGGADPRIANLVPSDIEIRRNYLFKPLWWRVGHSSYAGIHWSVKNLFELKNAQRVLVDGNLFENNWGDAQNGYGILFTPRNQDGTAPWSMVRDVTFTNNIVRHSGGGLNIMGTDNLYPSQQTQRILVQNNLFDDINGAGWGGTGTFMQAMDGGADIVIDHNTALHSGNTITATYNRSLLTSTSFVFTNNIASYNQFGIFGDYGVGLGVPAVNAYFPGSSFTRSAIVGGSASTWPADNYYPSALSAVGFIDMAGKNYALAAGTPYVRAGTDGKDVGVDFTAMAAAMAAGSSPAPSQAPAPAPAAAPAPTPAPTPAPPASSGGAAGTPQSATWINVVNATASGNSLTKTSGCDGCNDAGAITQQRITAGDGYAQFTAGANGPLRTAGLTQSFAVSSPGSIAFGLRFQGNFAEVREGGVYRADTPFTPGDVFRIAVQSGVVRYSKNGTVFYSSAATPGYPLVLAAALANRSATVSGAVITSAASSSSSSSSTPSAPSTPSVGSGSTAPSAIVWTNPINVTASGGSVSKTSGCDGCYDAGAVSQQQISGGNGYVQFTAGPTGTLRVAGLTASFSANNPNSIAFGLRLQGGIAEVREAGAYRADVAFAAGDVFRISVQGGAVSYSRNGTVFYRSSAASSSALALAVAIANMSGGIGNALLASGN
jgi:hypothetical protein